LVAGALASWLGRGWALPVATIVTAFAMGRWGWPVAVALLANWLSWEAGARMRLASIAAWGLSGWLGRGRWEVLALSGTGLLTGVMALLPRRKQGDLPMKCSWAGIGVAVSLALLFPRGIWAQAAEPGAVLFTEGFEGYQDAEQRVADGWQPWSLPGTDLPEYKQANPDIGLEARPYPYRVHTGGNAQQYFTVFRTHDAGLYRQVSVPPGATIQVSAWVQAWTSHADDPHRSDGAQPVNCQIGVDPAGGADPRAATVVWSPAIDPKDTWQPLTLRLTSPVPAAPSGAAQAGAAAMVTIFLRSAPRWPLKHNDVYWDDVQVTLVETRKAPAPSLSLAESDDSAAPGAPAPDPILAGLIAQQAARAGGWRSVLPGSAVASVGCLVLLFRKRSGR
jgi:MFS family permease